MDVAKALGMVAIVLAHATATTATAKYVSSFYIAIFFFVAGYFYKNSYDEHPGRLAIKRFRSLYVPYVSWHLAFLALHNTFYRLNILSSRAGYEDRVSHLLTPQQAFVQAVKIVTLFDGETLAGALWFVSALMVSTALYAFVSSTAARVAQRRARTVVLAFAAACAVAAYMGVPQPKWPAFLGPSLAGVAIMHIGRLYRQHEHKIPMRTSYGLASVAAVVITAGAIDIRTSSYGSPLTSVVALTSGLYATIWLAQVLRKDRFLGHLGQHTLTVAAAHMLAFKLVSAVFVWTHGRPLYEIALLPVATTQPYWYLAYAVVGLGLPLALSVMYQHGKRSALSRFA